MRLRSIKVVLLAWMAHASPGANIPDAFQPDTKNVVPPGYIREKGVTRVRAVKSRILLEPPRSLPYRMRFNFFRDSKFEVVWERISRQKETGAVEWTGRIGGSPIENAGMVVEGGRVTANVNPGNQKVYQVRTAEDLTIWVREFDLTTLPSDR